jgi:hypothetical protein
MNTLSSFQGRLEHDMPLWHWHCEPANNALIPNTDVPERILVSAERDGTALPGSPAKINGHALLSCGMDAVARLVLDELAEQTMTGRPLEWTWDKLAEC